MSRVVIVNIIRFVVLILLQVLLFKRINEVAFDWGSFGFVHFYIYPLFLLLLPVKTPPPLVIALGFMTGLCVDLWYDSPGVHAAACVITAYARSHALNLLEPYEGYNTNDSPNTETLGIGWFTIYSSILLAIFMFAYFSIEAFSFVFIFEIVLNTIFSLIASFLFVQLLMFVFRPKI